MRRRQFLATAGAGAIVLAFSPNASAQGRQVRIGLLTPVSPPPAYLAAFRDGLRERGYVEGQSLSIDIRWPPGPFEQNPGVAAGLVRANVPECRLWHLASFRCGAKVQTLLEVKRTCRELVGRVGPT